MSAIGIVYSYTEIETGICAYVGSTTGWYGGYRSVFNKRHRQHTNSRNLLGKAMRSIGQEAFRGEIVSTVTGNTYGDIRDDLRVMERYFIDTLKPKFNVVLPRVEHLMEQPRGKFQMRASKIIASEMAQEESMQSQDTYTFKNMENGAVKPNNEENIE